MVSNAIIRAQMTITSGTRLGPYEIVAPIGAGGMGEVWRGRDTRLDRSVAIKILPAEFAENAQFKVRFEREAKTISQLNHPNICTLYDVGDGYLVMELLEGESLDDRLKKGPLPLEQVLRYGTQIADALDRAHRSGIIHRDLKPGNIMITKSGAKLLDFGLAKSAAIFDANSATQHKALTQEGMILGTFQYMAPEQLEGEDADARTDIFGLGAVLYEMATARRAFQGSNKTSLIAAIVSGEPSPMSQIAPLTPPVLEHVVRKCLAKSRDDRWQSAHDIAEELRWIREAGSQAGVAAPLIARRKSRERLGWAAAVIVALAAGAFASRALHLGGESPKQQYRLTIPTIDSDYRFVFSPTLSPDGQTVYFIATNNENKRILLRRRIDDFHALQLEGTEGATTGFAISPDSRSVVFGKAAGVYERISVDGGPTEQVGVAESGSVAAIADDGTILVGSTSFDMPIRRVLPNVPAEAVLPLDKAHGEVGQAWPIFLPRRTTFGRGPQRFLFLSVSRDATRGLIRFTLCAASLGSQSVKRIGDVPSRVEYAGGRLFFVRNGTLMAQTFDDSKLQFVGEPVPVIGDVGFNSRSALANFSVSRDSTILCRSAASAMHLTWVDAAGKTLGTVGKEFSFAALALGGNNRLGISRQADRVVVAVNDHRAGTSSLWVQSLTRDTSTRVTFSSAAEIAPVLAPDGSRVFFASDAQSALDIYEAPLDGSEPPKLVVSAPNVQVPNDVSPDGRFLLYASNQNQTNARQDLMILPLTGERKPYPFLATPAIENSGVFSPDGKWIAYCSDATGQLQVYVRPFPGPGPARAVSSKTGNSPRFSADGKRIYFYGNAGTIMAADFHDGSVGEPKVLFQLSDRVAGYEPVGDRFLMVLVNDLEASPPARVIVNWKPPA